MKFVPFLIGAVFGFVICFYLVAGGNSTGGSTSSPSNNVGLSMFDEPGDAMSLKSFKVFQVMSNGNALAYSSEKTYVQYVNLEYGDPVVLLLSNDDMSFYDGQIVKVPQGKKVRQVGIYRYETKAENIKTVPAVRILK